VNKKTLLQTKNLTKTYNSKKAVDKLNLRVEEGDIYGFLGQNGSGKTTTIRMITGLIHPDAGEVKIGGYDLRSNFKKAISHVGAIVESPTFYSYLSAYDNLRLMANLLPDVTRAKIDEILDIVGLTNRAKDRVDTYSLGMKQRLGIANALLNYPKLIILDEPTNGLDPQGMKEIKELIVQLASEKNITFFISSHQLHEIEQICTKVGILQNGKLLAEGNVKQLLNTEEETVEISTPEIEKAKKILRIDKNVKNIHHSQNKLIIRINKGYSPNLNQLLVINNIVVNSIILRPLTLEQVFFDITERGGRR
jgi:ABC-type multidrug transport system ATPase subunit